MIKGGLVGQVKQAKGQIEFEWEIDDFLLLPAEVDKHYDSPMYFFCDSAWYFKIFPNGLRKDSSEGHIGLYVCRGDTSPSVSAIYSLFLKKTGGRKVVNEGKKIFEAGSSGWGAAKAISRSELIDQKWMFMSSGALTVTCSLKCDGTQGDRAEALRRTLRDCITSAEASTETAACVGTVKLLSDLKGLVVSGEGSDVTVTVQNEEFRLHRAIMAARTPVFNAMFKNNMKEKATGIVPIEDCDAETFRTFVHYLYTGSEDELCPENVVRVYEIADKYQVGELKTSCLDILKNTLSIGTFCDTLDLALRHGEQDLLEQATDFLSEHSSGIMGTEDWANLLSNKTRQINKLLMEAFIRKDRKLADIVKQ